MSSQINIKIDPQLKKQAEEVAKALGFNLSSITKAFFMHLIRTRRIDFYLDEFEDTPDDLTGEKLEKQLLAAGYSKKYAKRHGEAYNAMLRAEKEGKLIEC